MILTRRLFEILIRNIDIEELSEEDKEFELKDYIEASYLCNIGFLALEEYMYFENFNKDENFQLIKEHVSRSVDYLENNKFENVAKNS